MADPLPSSLPLRDKVVYSSGYFGVSLLSGLFMLWASYRYGELFTGGQKAFVGIALLVARFADAPVDPLVGWWSDRTRTRLGRRRPFIAYGAVPLVALFALVWAPPAGVNSVWNIVWLLGIGTGFFVLFSVVVNPYLAMLPDIARSPEDRVSVATLLAAFGLGAQIAAMIGGSLLAGRTGSFALTVAVTCLVALACLLLPLGVREREAGTSKGLEELRLSHALRQTLANRPFRVFLFSKCLYWVGVHTVLAVAPFLVRGVLGFSGEGDVQMQTAYLLACASAPAFVWFVAIGPLTRRFSKRTVSLAGLATLAVLALLLTTVGLAPLSPTLWARLIMGVGSFTVAALFSVPNAILAEIVDLDERVTGMRREATFFGAQGFFVKAAWGGSSLLVMAAQGLFHADPALAVRVSLLAVAAVS
ncbi:MAG: MFS transporter, partial [Armatimonadetes bacterium]|nr:MFS transporter [Armatimonadota bacterium]